MKRPNQRFRHLQSKRAQSDDPAVRQDPSETDTKNAIADFTEHVVELPTYDDRTEHVEPNAVRQWLLLWIPALLLLGGVIFGGVYGGIALERRHSATQERLRTLQLVRREIEQHLQLLQQQATLLAALEKGTERLQSDLPTMPTTYPVPVWRAVAGKPDLLENAPLYSQLTTFYDSLAMVSDGHSPYDAACQGWQKAIKGLTLDRLRETRDARLLKSVVKAREDLLSASRGLRQAIQTTDALGQQALRLLPENP